MVLNKMSKHPDMSYSRAYGSSFIQSTATAIALMSVYKRALKSKQVQKLIMNMVNRKYRTC